MSCQILIRWLTASLLLACTRQYGFTHEDVFETVFIKRPEVCNWHPCDFDSLCESMLPQHGDSLPQTTIPPYHVEAHPTRVSPGGVVNVNISSYGEYKWKGIYMQARDIHNNHTVGQFLHPHTAYDHIILQNCNGTHDAISYIDRKGMRSFEFQWQAPKEPVEIKFWVTVVKEYETFWLGLTSETVTVNTRIIDPSGYEVM